MLSGVPLQIQLMEADHLPLEWPKRNEETGIHPVQEVNAYKEAVKAEFKSRSEVAAEYGEDVVKIDMENAADQPRARDLKLSYSVYPEINGEFPPLPDTPNSAAIDTLAEQDNTESSGNLWPLPSELKDGSHFWLSKAEGRKQP